MTTTSWTTTTVPAEHHVDVVRVVFLTAFGVALIVVVLAFKCPCRLLIPRRDSGFHNQNFLWKRQIEKTIFDYLGSLLNWVEQDGTWLMGVRVRMVVKPINKGCRCFFNSIYNSCCLYQFRFWDPKWAVYWKLAANSMPYKNVENRVSVFKNNIWKLL